jgi:hypothetical protein
LHQDRFSPFLAVLLDDDYNDYHDLLGQRSRDGHPELDGCRGQSEIQRNH